MWTITSTSISSYRPKLDPHGIEGMVRVNEEVKNPTWDQVRAFINRLDGHCCTEMSLDGLNRYGMTVSGGADRFCVCASTEETGGDLLGPDPSDEQTTIIVAGVETYLPRCFIATRQQALQAAEYFYHHGRIDPGLNWHLW